jgi:hypothetical protein
MDRSTDALALARRMWLALEPLHAVTYFAPEVREALDGVGMQGFWMGYFAARAAPVGPVGPAVVGALFYNFHPAMVQRALPDAWRLATPEAVLSARLHGIDVALWRLLDEELRAPDIAAAAQAARKAAEAADCRGRALAAAHQALDWPTVPHLTLWQAATVLREHRGDGHVATLLGAGVDGCQANVLAVAAGVTTADLQRDSRRWSDVDWEEAQTGLVRRGWLDHGGRLTAVGQDARRRIEEATDDLAAGPFLALDADEHERLVAVAERLSASVVEQQAVPFPNPIGLPRLPERRRTADQ